MRAAKPRPSRDLPASSATALSPERIVTLTAATGGEVCFPRKLEDVTPALERIARDIRSSYTIGYVPPADAAKTPRRIRVDVHPGDGRKLAVRTRTSYVRDEAPHP